MEEGVELRHMGENDQTGLSGWTSKQDWGLTGNKRFKGHTRSSKFFCVTHITHDIHI